MQEWIILVLIVFAASLLQTSTGYGFSIIGTPFLLLIYPGHTAIQINIILSLCLSAFMIFKIGREVDKPLFIRLMKGSIPGLVIGLFIYLYLDIRVLKMIVGGLILLLTIGLIFKLTMLQSRNRDFITGGISGLLTTSIGVPGPPLLLYFSGIGKDKAVLRSTTLAYYLFVYSASLVMQISFGGTDKEAWISSLVAVPSLIAGILLGQLLFRWISPNIFRVITYVILLFTGGYLLLSAF
ncbi:sulfite exporter TauE/SafE family protein [Paenibacillus spongiae]|uniref:Probable membrane transporter protein n=1 Tax=Paenibacillus spongiae TaxID=2909671 RepID=A0ABY5S7R5_9BACL|nr:sulfite exporter TauE/SafE family protein [Paenibacillus spongiae]UVI29714.1 sulfite exporter TauE/SafE family protein [Paenibacillus spongiae]